MSLFEDAVRFALEKHSGQRRKGADVPYILHPFEAATIVATMTEDENVLAAAVLHDTIEDAGVTLDEVEERFGPRVAALVMTETEDKRENLDPSATWQDRKEETLMILKNSRDLAVKMLWMGDKLSNMRSFYRQYLEFGNAMWQNYHQKDPKIQSWYYHQIAEYTKDLAGFEAYREFVRLMNAIFSEVE